MNENHWQIVKCDGCNGVVGYAYCPGPGIYKSFPCLCATCWGYQENRQAIELRVMNKPKGEVFK